MSSNEETKKDQWSSKTYATSASFVPNLASVILGWLDPQPTDRILDIGCGDGKFTSHFLDKCHEVYGVDASPQFIKEAREIYGRETPTDNSSKVTFNIVDCTELEKDPYSVEGKWDKVISNAALHWILRNPQTRRSTLLAIYQSLRPGGTFTFELGGAGNVSEISSALIPILRSHGFALSEAQDLIPWFFPDAEWMTSTLEDIGFKVEKMDLVPRPTKLDPRKKSEDGREEGGMPGWVRLMLSPVLDGVERRLGKNENVREEVVKQICEAVEWATTRPGDANANGDANKTEYLGYVRLRGMATKI